LLLALLPSHNKYLVASERRFSRPETNPIFASTPLHVTQPPQILGCSL
jgi:hypothetical protein